MDFTEGNRFEAAITGAQSTMTLADALRKEPMVVSPLERVLKMGSTGDSPVPGGDPPTGTAESKLAKRPSLLDGNAAPIPSGESPDGTGASPALPGIDFPNTPLVKLTSQKNACLGLERILNQARLNQSQIEKWQSPVLADGDADGLKKSLDTKLFINLKGFRTRQVRFQLAKKAGAAPDSLFIVGTVLLMRATGQLSKDRMFFLDQMQDLLAGASVDYPQRVKTAGIIMTRLQSVQRQKIILSRPIGSDLTLPGGSRINAFIPADAQVTSSRFSCSPPTPM